MRQPSRKTPETPTSDSLSSVASTYSARHAILYFFGAFPVFVVDGILSPLKSRARILRFFRASGIDLSSLPVAEDVVSVERNHTFLKCVQECVKLLELLGMPVLKAEGEAEALCAHLNRGCQVHACITADSDAFLFGAECVIKCLRPNFKEPFECYYISDIEAGLGLKRNHLIAISLLVGNDHDLTGVQGIGLDTALRFVKSFSDKEILNSLCKVGKGDTLQFQGVFRSVGDTIPSFDGSSLETKPHCSLCGHPGSRRAHTLVACEYCSSMAGKGCLQKPEGFKCDCSSCDLDKKEKEKRNENLLKVCKSIATEQGFPNDEIIKMYLSQDQVNFLGGLASNVVKSLSMDDINSLWQHALARDEGKMVAAELVLVGNTPRASSMAESVVEEGKENAASMNRLKLFGLIKCIGNSWKPLIC